MKGRIIITFWLAMACSNSSDVGDGSGKDWFTAPEDAAYGGGLVVPEYSREEVPSPQPAPSVPDTHLVFHCNCLKQIYVFATLADSSNVDPNPDRMPENIHLILKLDDASMALYIPLKYIYFDGANNTLEFNFPPEASILAKKAQFTYASDNTPQLVCKKEASAWIDGHLFKKLLAHRMRSFSNHQISDGIYANKRVESAEVFSVQKDKIYLGTEYSYTHVFKLDGTLGNSGRLIRVPWMMVWIGDDTDNSIQFTIPKNYQFEVETVNVWETGEYQEWLFNQYYRVANKFHGVTLNERPDYPIDNGVAPTVTTQQLNLSAVKSAYQTFMNAQQGSWSTGSDTTITLNRQLSSKPTLADHTGDVQDTQTPDSEVAALYQKLGL